MSKLERRAYEIRAVAEIRAALEQHRRVVAVGPTGCGKTVRGSRESVTAFAERRFCNHTCFGASRRRSVPCVCNVCGKATEGRRHTCSDDCDRIARKRAAPAGDRHDVRGVGLTLNEIAALTGLSRGAIAWRVRNGHDLLSPGRYHRQAKRR